MVQIILFYVEEDEEFIEDINVRMRSFEIKIRF